MSSYEIERLMKIGQGSLPFDPADHARNLEQLNCRPEERFVIGIESEHVVPEIFTNVKKVAGARAEIENTQQRRAIEPKILRPLDVDVDPIGDVFETINSRRARPIRVFLAQVFKLQPVDVVQNPTLVDGMGGTDEMFERAREQVSRKDFPKLA